MKALYRKTLFRGLAITLILSALTYLVASALDLFERLLPLMEEYEAYNLDEFFFVAIVAFLCLVILAFKLQKEIAVLRMEAELNRLKKLLPICAHCKKIRNDKGYWQQVEEYIGTHTDTRFSHGLCEGCAERHYAEFQPKKVG